MTDVQIPNIELKESPVQIQISNDVRISKDELMKKQASFVGLILLVALVCSAIIGMSSVV